MMATTLTLACLRPGGLIEIGHVGDSRAYVGDGTTLLQVSEEHTAAMDLVRSGELAADDAEDHPGWHTISSWIGWEACRADSKELQLEAGERLLLCSDGLSNMVGDDDIASLLFSGSPDEAAAALIAAANAAGGSDNITVVVAEVGA